MADERISVDRMDGMLRAVFQELNRLGGRARPKQLFEAIEPRLGLTEYERARSATGAIHWETHIRFYTTDCVRAGYLTKSGGYWILTDDGERALGLPAGQLVRSAQRKYREWRREQSAAKDLPEPAVEEVGTEVVERQAVYEQAVEDARTEIENHLNALAPYDFQKLVAELLRGMGYHVPHVAPPGPDGGIDLLAYKDPLATSTPRIKVQVKHREQKASVKEIRELEGLLRKEVDMGLFVSSGGFTAEAEREIRSSIKHIETMDLERVTELWQEHYEQISERGKQLLPLAKVYFLAPAEE